MTLVNLSIANSINFHSLALFVCHLFADGQFQSGCILHDSNVLQIGEIISEIQSVCPDTIPWQMIDISKPLSLTWQANQRIDRILQLVFFDVKNPQRSIDDFKDLFTFYRLVVFSSTDEANFKQQIDAMIKLNSNILLRSVILHYNSTDVTVLSQWKDKKDIDHDPFSVFEQKINVTYSVQHTRHNITSGGLFESVFRAYNENWAIGIRYDVTIPLNHYEILDEDPMVANFFFWDLKAKYINMSTTSNTKATSSWKIRRAQHKNGRVYRELSSEYELLDNDQIMANITKDNLKIVNFDLKPFNKIDSNDENSTSLYPYHSTDLALAYVYGAGVNRQRFRGTFTKKGSSLAVLGTLTCVISAVVLCFLRKWYRLRRADFGTAFIDVMIAFAGGGNVVLNHRCERLIFTFLFVGFFFFTTYWVETFIFPFFLFHNGSISTFDDFETKNAPIFNSIILKKSERIVQDMLREKLGESIRFEGSGQFYRLFNEHDGPFGYVIKKSLVNHLKILAHGSRDVDVISKPLGSISVAFSLKSDQHIPERMERAIDGRTSSMTENGLHTFYHSFSAFLFQLKANQFRDHDCFDEFQALNVQQIIPLLMYLCFNFTISFTAFVIEIISNRINTGRWNRQ